MDKQLSRTTAKYPALGFPLVTFLYKYNGGRPMLFNTMKARRRGVVLTLSYISMSSAILSGLPGFE